MSKNSVQKWFTTLKTVYTMFQIEIFFQFCSIKYLFLQLFFFSCLDFPIKCLIPTISKIKLVKKSPSGYSHEKRHYTRSLLQLHKLLSRVGWVKPKTGHKIFAMSLIAVMTQMHKEIQLERNSRHKFLLAIQRVKISSIICVITARTQAKLLRGAIKKKLHILGHRSNQRDHLPTFTNQDITI